MSRQSKRGAPSKERARPFEGVASGPTTHYAIVPRSIPFVNRGRFWSGDKLVKRAPRLVITQDRVRGEVNLWFCDSRWRIRNATSASTVAEAKRDAERFYPGLRPHWVSLGVTAAAAERYMRRLRAEEGCSFCRRAPAEHGSPQFEAGAARICGSCILKFHAELRSLKKA